MSAKDTLAIGTTDATDTLLTGKPVTPDYGRFATLQTPGVVPQDNRAKVAMFSQILEDAERYRQAYEEEWMRLYSQYHGATSTEGKAPWQSLAHAPFSKRDVDTIASKIVSIVFSENDWFGIKPRSRVTNGLVDIAKEEIDVQLHKGKFREPLETSIKDALICGTGPLKITYERVLKPYMAADFTPDVPLRVGNQVKIGPGSFNVRRAMRAVSGIQMRPVIPTDFWLDPSGQNRYVIHRSKRHLSDLWKLTKPQVDPMTGEELLPAIYDADEVSRIRPGSRDRKLDQFASTIRRERYLAYEDMTVDVYEIWGDIPDPSTGVVMYPNCFATFVDKQWLLRPPQENPFWHQRLPFIDFRAMLNPHQIYGYGFLTQGSLLQFEIDRVLQLMIDKMTLSVGMAEADAGALKNSEDAGGSHVKVDPARIWWRKNQERAIFFPIKITEGPTTADAQVYQLLQQAREMTTNVNEWSTGQNQSTTRKTAKEAEIKVSASQSQFNDIGQYMEEHSLAPFVQLIWELSIQYENFQDPELLERFADNANAQQLLAAFAAMKPEERWAKMNMDAQFRVDGITRQVTRQQRLDRLINFLKFASGNQATAAIIDWRTVLQEAMVDFEMPSNMVLPQDQAVLQAAEQAAIAMFMNMVSGQGQPGQPGQPPPPGQPTPGQNAKNQQAQAAAEPAGPPQ